MLTAKSGVDDKVEGLDSGADDYLTKPFDSKELLARVRALTRRNINTPDNTLTFGDIVLDPNTFNLNCRTTGQSIRLGKKEFRILEYLICNQKQILTREQLAEKYGDTRATQSTTTLRRTCLLREKTDLRRF